MNINRIESTIVMDGLLHLYYNRENNDCDCIFGITSPDKHFHPVSIEDLRKDIEEQMDALASGFDKYGEVNVDNDVLPWKGILVCREGLFVWHQGDYLRILLGTKK